MSTWTSQQVIRIAERIVAEHAAGQAIDPLRLEWARFIVKANCARPALLLVPAVPRERVTS